MPRGGFRLYACVLSVCLSCPSPAWPPFLLVSSIHPSFHPFIVQLSCHPHPHTHSLHSAVIMSSYHAPSFSTVVHPSLLQSCRHVTLPHPHLSLPLSFPSRIVVAFITVLKMKDLIIRHIRLFFCLRCFICLFYVFVCTHTHTHTPSSSSPSSSWWWKRDSNKQVNSVSWLLLSSLPPRPHLCSSRRALPDLHPATSRRLRGPVLFSYSAFTLSCPDKCVCHQFPSQ